MPLTVAVVRERLPGERRVALVPDTARKYAGLGAVVRMEQSAGIESHFLDSDYEGVIAVPGVAEAYAGADLILRVTPPSAEEIAALPEGAMLIGLLAPYADRERIAALNRRRITAFALELLPRISRAQSMDALSSQGACSGYQCGLIAAGRYSDAYMINWRSNVFPGILGRVCDRPCEPACRRVGIGIVLAIYCVLTLRRGGLPKVARASRVADAGIGLLSGAMGGATGVSGPPVVLWCAMRGWDKETQRATFQTFFVGILLVILAFQAAHGLVDGRSLRLAASAILPIVLFSWLGSLAYRRLNQVQFQRVVVWLLLLSGLALVAGGL